LAIRLKNMSKQEKKVFIIWGIFTVALVIHLCLWRSPGSYGVSTLEMASLLTLIVLETIAIFAYITSYPEEERRELKAGWWDKVKTEILAAMTALLLLGVWAITSGMRGNYSLQYRWGFVPSLFISFGVFLLPSALLQGMIVLFVRKKLLRTIEEDSVLWKKYRSWKEAELFEKRLRKEEHFGLVVVMLSALAMLLINLYEGLAVWWSPFFVLISGVAVAGVLIGAAIIRLKSKSYKDVGKLLHQIDVMAEGNLELETEEIDDPDIRRSSEKLCGISKNLKHIMEKQMQAERMKIDLITNVSHDLKTPLTSMVGYIDLLKKEELSSEAKDYVEILGVKQEQLKDMIQDIFELSKATSGTVELELEELDMKKLLEQTLGDMEDAITESGMVIRKRLSEEPAKFIGDSKKMYRVFQNLISNALKYSLKGTRIYIEETRVGKKIEVAVKNTSSYEMDFTEEEVLERFARADRARNTEGHGLGLAIAESFVKNMGGTFHVEIDGDQFKVTVIMEAL